MPPFALHVDDLAFQLVHQGRERTNLRCASARACHAWMHAIDAARSDCLAAAVSGECARSHLSFGEASRTETCG